MRKIARVGAGAVFRGDGAAQHGKRRSGGSGVHENSIIAERQSVCGDETFARVARSGSVFAKGEAFTQVADGAAYPFIYHTLERG
ncbi:MAG: hypothetical protein LBM59_00935 [Ruminococcus sp.]|nr:hypothetical protein [Ruminococcus sp.]